MTAATLSFQHYDTLIHFARRVKTCSDASVLYQMFLSDAQRLVPCQHATLYLFQEQAQELFPVASYSSLDSETGLDVQTQDEKSGRISIRDRTSIVAWAASHRHPLLCRPTQIAFDHAGNNRLSEIAVPLIANHMLYAVLMLQRYEPFNGQELRYTCNICDIAAVAIANVQLFQRGRSDQEQLRTILSTIAHELRSPLNTINGYLELTLSGTGGDSMHSSMNLCSVHVWEVSIYMRC